MTLDFASAAPDADEDRSDAHYRVPGLARGRRILTECSTCPDGRAAWAFRARLCFACCRRWNCSAFLVDKVRHAAGDLAKRFNCHGSAVQKHNPYMKALGIR